MASHQNTPPRFRPAQFTGDETDLPFLLKLYAESRQQEVAQTGWAQDQIDAFLKQQFEAQHTYYLEQFTCASFDIILDNSGAPIGRLYLEEREDEFRIIDITLLYAQCGQGIGGKLIEDVIDKAAALGKAVRIHVEHTNRAMHLYKRLGFRMIEDQGIYHLMELTPMA